MKPYLKEMILSGLIIGTIFYLIWPLLGLHPAWGACVFSAGAASFSYHLFKGNVQIADCFTPWMLRLGTPKEWIVTAFAVALVFILMALALIAL